MNPVLHSSPTTTTGGAQAVEPKRVLRNTYWLLALSMVPPC